MITEGVLSYPDRPETRPRFNPGQADWYENHFLAFIQNSNEKEETIKVIRNKILPKVKKDRFLDVGAGEGVLTKAIGATFKEIWAVEPLKIFAPKIREGAKINLVTGLWQDVADNVPGKFDFILNSHVLYHLDSREINDLLRGLIHHLTPTGKLAIILNSQIESVKDKKVYYSIFHRFPKHQKKAIDSRDVRRHLEGYDCQVELIRFYPKISTPHRDEFIKAFLFLLLEPHEHLGYFLAELEEYIETFKLDSEYTIFIPQDIILVDALKG